VIALLRGAREGNTGQLFAAHEKGGTIRTSRALTRLVSFFFSMTIPEKG